MKLTEVIEVVGIGVVGNDAVDLRNEHGAVGNCSHRTVPVVRHLTVRFHQVIVHRRRCLHDKRVKEGIWGFGEGEQGNVPGGLGHSNLTDFQARGRRVSDHGSYHGASATALVSSASAALPPSGMKSNPVTSSMTRMGWRYRLVGP